MSLPNPTFIGQQATVEGKTYEAVSVNPPVWRAKTTGTHGARIQRLEGFPTVSDMRAGVKKSDAGYTVSWGGYYTNGDGGGNKGIVRIGDSTSLVDDGGSIFIIVNDVTNGVWVEANIKNPVVNSNHFGAFATTGAVVDNTTQLQNLAKVCCEKGIPFYLVAGESEEDEYKITQPIVFTANVNQFGLGAWKVRVLTVNCNPCEYPVGASNVTIKRVRYANASRHTVTPNNLIGIEFKGTTLLRPFYNTVEECFFDGYARTFVTEWAWELNINKNSAVGCGKFLQATGISVNNRVIGNSGKGNGVCFEIGDGTNTVEGWWIETNLMDEFASAGVMSGGSFNRWIDNIFDHLSGGGTGVLFASSGSLPSYGNKFKDNYMAFSSNADEGLRLLNNLTNAAHAPTEVCGNEIFAYSGYTVSKPLLVDGAEELNNKYDNNTFRGSAVDMDLKAGAKNSIVTGNCFAGGGFNTVNKCHYTGNDGVILCAEAFCGMLVGKTYIGYDASQPTSGEWDSRDEIISTNHAIDGVTGRRKAGWKRLTTGSGNVAGVDWVEHYLVTTP